MVRESSAFWISWKCSCPLAEELQPKKASQAAHPVVSKEISSDVTLPLHGI